jgi:hypothetical protein
MNDEEYYKVKIIGIMFFTILICVFMICASIIFSSSIEAEGNIECNSGNIGIDIESFNNIQKYKCTPFGSDKPQDCFNQDLMLKHINLDGINDLNCKASGKVKFPMYYTFFNNNLFGRRR